MRGSLEERIEASLWFGQRGFPMVVEATDEEYELALLLLKRQGICDKVRIELVDSYSED